MRQPFVFYRTPTRHRMFDLANTTELPRVEIISTYAGVDGALLRAALNSGNVSGLVIAEPGLGSVPSLWLGVFSWLVHSTFSWSLALVFPPVEFFHWRLMPAGHSLLSGIGCVLSDSRSPQKARILLMSR